MIDSFTLADVRDWIRTLGVGEHFYIGKIDSSKDKSVGVYERPSYGPADISLGGFDSTKTEMMQISLLIHWNKNARETDENARALYNSLLQSARSRPQICGVSVDYIRMGTQAPRDLGSDAAGVYERMIEIDIYYQRYMTSNIATSEGDVETGNNGE